MKKAYTTKNGAEVRITRENIETYEALESRLDGCIDDLADKGYKTIGVRVYKDPKDRICYSIKAKKGTKEGTNVLEISSTYFSKKVNLTSVRYGTGELPMGERAKLLAGPFHEEFKKRVKNL